MVNPNKKVKRVEAKKYKGNLLFGGRNVKKILKQDFGDIYEEMINEFPNIKLAGGYDLLKEIIIEGELVGFSLFTFGPYDYIYLEYFYVLEEYRDKFDLTELLTDVRSSADIIDFIHNPSRDIVEKLIEGDDAYIMDGRFVISNIGFFSDFVSNEFSLSNTIENSCDLRDVKDVELYEIHGNIYDLELCTVVPYVSSDDDDKESSLKLSVAYKSDDEKYDCLNKRSNDVLIKENRYMAESLKVFNEYMEIHGGELGFDLR